MLTSKQGIQILIIIYLLVALNEVQWLDFESQTKQMVNEIVNPIAI